MMETNGDVRISRTRRRSIHRRFQCWWQDLRWLCDWHPAHADRLAEAVYTVIGLVGEQRVHRLARFAAGNVLTRYTVLPLLAMFFLTNPMAYTFGMFVQEKHKP